MKKILAIALALMMLVPMVLAIVPASATEGGKDGPSYVDMTERRNVKTYEQGSGFTVAGGNDPVYSVTKNPNAVAGTYATLQYAGKTEYDKQDYAISYTVKLAESKKAETMTFVYWQDWGYLSATDKTVRTFASKGKAAGAGLYMTSDGTNLSFLLLTYNQAGFAYSKGVLAAGSSAATLPVEGNDTFKIDVDFDYDVNMVVTVTGVQDTTKTVTFTYDLTNAGTKANLDSVTDPQNFAFSDWKSGSADAVESFADLKINNGEPVNFLLGFNTKNYGARMTGFKKNENAPLSVLKADSAAKDYILQYAGAEQYDKTKYSFSYEAEYKADANATTYTYVYWDELVTLNPSTNRSWASAGKLNGLNIMIVYDATAKSVKVDPLAYNESGSVSRPTLSSGTATDTTLMAGITANTKLIIAWDFEYTATAKTLVVDVTRADDKTKTIELTYDLSSVATSLDAVTAPAHPAIVNTAAAPVESIGNLVFANGEVETGDTNLEQPEWAFNTDVAVNDTDWAVYVPRLASREGFKIDNGYFTRTTNDSIDYIDAYACARYMGGLTDNYKLQYNIKLNEDNRCRVHTYVRWDPTDHMLNQKLDGFAVTVEIDAEGLVNLSGIYYEGRMYKVQIACTPETAGNKVETAGSNILKDVAKGQGEITVTIVAIDDKISVSVALASDPTKTTGEVIFDLSAYATVLANCKDDAGFAVLDGACEVEKNGIETDADQKGIKPCSVGAFKLWLTEAPQTTTTTTTTTTESTTTAETTTAATTTAAATTAADKTEATTAAEEKKGCGSSITATSFVAVASVAVGALAITKKRKED